MYLYIARRLITGFFIIVGASFIVYMLMTLAGDPLEFTLNIQNPVQRQQAVDSVTKALNLDVNPVARYFMWLGDVLTGDFGVSARTNQPVNADLASRVPLTLKLVSAALVLSIVIGVSVGLITALKQYSGFDYLVTFFTFVFFSLPVFWVGVILKSYGGINFNDWLRDGAHFRPGVIALIAAAACLLGYSFSAGRPARRWLVGLCTATVVGGLVIYVANTQWILDPGLGVIGVGILAVLIASATTAIMAGWRNEKARSTAFSTAALGIVMWFPLQALFDGDAMSLWLLLALAVVAIACGVAIGIAWGGFDRGLSSKVGAATAFLIGVVMFVDRAMRSWSDYSSNSVIRNRPIKTIGDREARLQGDFWIHTADTFSHLVLPTIVLMLISVATYTRYSRASMLEVLNQDYIRTARSKGLTERTVIVRHGLRNALIPIATVVAVDIGGVLGGAVITESVFEWNAMGRMFIDGLRSLDPNPVMASFVVVAVFAIIANLLADLAYAALDPRIRIRS